MPSIQVASSSGSHRRDGVLRGLLIGTDGEGLASLRRRQLSQMRFGDNAEEPGRSRLPFPQDDQRVVRI
jgi:hypothetical protein